MYGKTARVFQFLHASPSTYLSPSMRCISTQRLGSGRVGEVRPNYKSSQDPNYHGNLGSETDNQEVRGCLKYLCGFDSPPHLVWLRVT